MRHDFDDRGRAAAAGLRNVVDRAELTSVAPGLSPAQKRRVGVRRPALVASILLMGSAVGVAMVVGPSETTPTTVPVETTVQSTTTVPEQPTATTVPVVVVPPSTSVPADTQPPVLVITSPADGATMQEKTVQFEGITEPGARVFAGKWEADVDGEGNWKIILVLAEGANRARFTARDAAGNESFASVIVHYVPTTTTTTKPETKPEKADFTAHATFGTCTEDPPYDIYYGTGEPGSTVYVDSAYGSGSVVVSTDGKWEIKVFFLSAPADQVINVKVYDEFGRKKTFEFTYIP